MFRTQLAVCFDQLGLALAFKPPPPPPTFYIPLFSVPLSFSSFVH
jgi:hypothetical protein